MKQKKCSICGSTNLRMVPGGNFYKPSLDTSFSTCFNTLVCCDCGHIDLYADEEILAEVIDDKNKEDHNHSLSIKCEKIVKEANKKLSDLNNQIEKALKKEQEIERKSKDVNITVKEQQELLAQLEEAKEETASCRRRHQEFAHEVSNFVYYYEKFKKGEPFRSTQTNPLTGELLEDDD